MRVCFLCFTSSSGLEEKRKNMAADPKETTGARIPFSSSGSLLRTYLTPHWFSVSGLTLLLFGSIGFEILGPQLLGHFFDSIPTTINLLFPLALLFLVL